MPILSRRILKPPLPGAFAAATAIPGILAGQAAANPALLRMLSRARRRQLPLLLIRVEWPEAAPGARRRVMEALPAELRISDLAWWATPGAVVMLLLESAEEEAAVVGRLARRAAEAGVEARTRVARFPQQGLTLAALLEGVREEVA